MSDRIAAENTAPQAYEFYAYAAWQTFEQQPRSCLGSGCCRQCGRPRHEGRCAPLPPIEEG